MEATMRRLLLSLALALGVFGVFGVSAASAATLTICESGPPTCDYKSIQEAIDAARSGDKIEIAVGTYHEHLEVPGGGTATRLTLQGAGAAQTTIESTVRGVTISSGASVAIIGVTITGAGAGKFFEGGGIDNYGTLTLSDSTVSHNGFVRSRGCCSAAGGIVNWAGTVTLNDSTVSDNLASHEDSGGIANHGGTITLNGSTVSDNRVGNGSGGGIANENGGTMTLNDSTVTGNRAGCDGCGGGGIVNGKGGTMTLNDSTVTDNEGEAGPLTTGGGIYNDGTLTLNDSTVSGNRARHGGGIFSDEDGTMTLNRTTVSENTAGGKGGGIFNSGSLTGRHDVITGNTAPEGAGIFNEPPGEVNLTKSKVQP
jgi:hypothetical protein